VNGQEFLQGHGQPALGLRPLVFLVGGQVVSGLVSRGTAGGGVDVADDGRAAAYVDGIDQAVEGFDGVVVDGEYADAVDHDDVAVADLGDGADDG
jgi:hypothetical protein